MTYKHEVVALSQPRLLCVGPRLDIRDEDPAVVATDQPDVLQQVVALQWQLLHRLQGPAESGEGGKRRAERPARARKDTKQKVFVSQHHFSLLFLCAFLHQRTCCTSPKRVSWRCCWPAPGHKCPFLQTDGKRKMSAQREDHAHPLRKE